MPSAENMNLSLIVLLTGLVVVFAALIFLTFIIKGYGALVSSMTAKSKQNGHKAGQRRCQGRMTLQRQRLT